MATAITTITTTSSTTMEQPKRQRPLRGISIIIESEEAAAAAAKAAATAKPATSSSGSNESEMSLKSQAMLLAFGDSSNKHSNNNSNMRQRQPQSVGVSVDHATKAEFETSCNTITTTTTTTATTNATKMYPQLLLRIGEADSANAGEIVAPTTPAAAAAATATTTTIISCNNEVEKGDNDVRNVLLPSAGEIEPPIAALRDAEAEDNDETEAVAAARRASAVTETVGGCAPKDAQHTVKIQIQQQQQPPRVGKQISVVTLNDSEAMVLQQQVEQQQVEQPPSSGEAPPYQLCQLVSSGQYSPCETLDSGTGSDLESVKSPKLELHLKTTKIRVNTSSSNSNSHANSNSTSNSTSTSAVHVRAYSLTDSEECDESSSSLSCDSLHSSEFGQQKPQNRLLGALLPDSLLRDIRERERERAEFDSSLESVDVATNSANSYVQQQNQVNQANNQVNVNGNSLAATKIDGRPLKYEADQYYTFHVNEHASLRSFGQEPTELGADLSPEYETHSLLSAGADEDDDAFAGYKDVRCCSQPSTIRSSKGTVRGVKNRVRNGVATFLQLQQPNVKNYKEKDVGKVVLYTTSMGIIRDTFGKCANVKQILRTLLIKFEERDIFMSVEYQQEMRERMHDDTIRVPQLFVEGQHIGDADTVERMNETGELRQLLKPYKSLASSYTCQMCGGYRLLPCPSCSGSKKSVHRNHFTAEFVALKCMNCDEVGLVKCQNC